MIATTDFLHGFMIGALFTAIPVLFALILERKFCKLNQLILIIEELSDENNNPF